MVYWAPPAFGLKLSQAFNDACTAAHRGHPDRVLGTIMLPMQAPELAVQELGRAAKLPGMRAVYMAMHVNGKNPDDKSFWPVYERIEQLGLPLCLHPVNPCCRERMGGFHHPRIMRFLIDLVGADRIVVGSDYNFDMGYERPIDFVDQIPGLSQRERELILGGNMARLFKL